MSSDDDTDLYSWNNEGNTGFLPLGKSYPGRISMRINVYYTSIETNDPHLANATIEQAWSLHNGGLWVVHHLTTAHGKYLFHKVTRSPFGGEGSAYTFVEENGPYHLLVGMRYLLDDGYQNVLLSVPSPSCAGTDGLPSPQGYQLS